MSGLCAVLAAGLTVLSPSDSFQLSWTHSVEKVEWREDWRVEAGRLVLERASVAGSGAGMEPPPEAVRDGDRWVWNPGLVKDEIVSRRSAPTRFSMSRWTGSKAWRQASISAGCN
ncbi:MAG: DUF1850 domain-containing protein [Magnetospirillum sp.]|nr:DUF1850 domain-containing protein [Magnetospirillum sp.]